VGLPDGRVVSYEYQGGRRTAKRVNGEPSELFRWQGPRLAAWQDLRDGTLVRFEYADERARLPVALHDGADRFWLAFDQVGSLRAVANDQGKVVKRITYDTFGNVIDESAPQVVIPLGFAGGLRDVDTGLTRFGVRDYDPLFGRFIARDPLGAAAGDPDVYGYCLDDPVNMVDPTGYSGIALPGPIPMPLPPVFIPGTRENREATRPIANALWGMFSDTEVDEGAIGQLPSTTESNVPEADIDGITQYGEHKNKGTTNPANKNKHEEGDARRKRDNPGGEKGDKRRKRHK
jgi:RHS repeat-associated protein